MRRLVLGFLVLGFARAVSAAPIFCSDEATGYTLRVANDGKTATLHKDGASLQFGALECRVPQERVAGRALILRCNSPHVADAGYGVAMFRADDQITAEVAEMSFHGTDTIANMTCVAAAN